MTKEEITKLLSQKNDVLKVFEIAKEAAYSVFETSPITDIQSDIVDWVYQEYINRKKLQS